MKQIIFIMFLIFPLMLFSQTEGITRLHCIFAFNSEELRYLITSKQSQVKMSNEEIDTLTKIINERREEFNEINKKTKKSIHLDANRKPIGKADPELLKERDLISNEVCTSIYKILGDKRYKQFNRTLIDESERQNMERLKNAGKSKKK